VVVVVVVVVVAAVRGEKRRVSISNTTLARKWEIVGHLSLSKDRTLSVLHYFSSPVGCFVSLYLLQREEVELKRWWRSSPASQ